MRTQVRRGMKSVGSGSVSLTVSASTSFDVNDQGDFRRVFLRARCSATKGQ